MATGPAGSPARSPARLRSTIEDSEDEVVAGPAILRWLGRVDYEPTWRAMQRFNDRRGPGTPDEIWFLEHPPVFTQGMNGRPEHLLAPGDIPVVAIDRGGQVTYHGPGQLVVYPLLDLRRLRIGIRELVIALERAVAGLAREHGIDAAGRRDAPGVYCGGRKLASLGLRVRRGASYHGLALNVDMDLEPFRRINPCGYQGLEMTQLASLGARLTVREAAAELAPWLCAELGLQWDGGWVEEVSGEQ
jgi:lipoyl(octanoyl) transferase